MNAILTQTLRELRMRQVGKYVFADSDGNPFGDVKKGFKAAVRRAGLEGVVLTISLGSSVAEHSFRKAGVAGSNPALGSTR